LDLLTRMQDQDAGVTEADTVELTAAHQGVVAVVESIQDAALDWCPEEEEWSLKQTIGHIAHAYDFFVMIVEEARAQDFGSVRLYQELAGWQRMLNTDGAVAACSTVSAALARLEQAYKQALPVLQGITPEELDHPFVLYSWRPDAAPVGTTLRQRVLR